MAQNGSQLNDDFSKIDISNKMTPVELQEKLFYILKKKTVTIDDFKHLVSDISVKSISNVIRAILSLFKQSKMWDQMTNYTDAINCVEELSKNNELVFKQSLELVLDETFDEYNQFLRNRIKLTFSDIDINRISVLINIPALLTIKTYEPILYSLVKFLDNFCQEFNSIMHFQEILINLVLHSNLYLVSFLAVHQNNLQQCRGLKETINVYNTLKDNLINRLYNNSDSISNVLTVLEQRSRYFGMTADAIPENENHGDYIVVDSFNAPLEDDEVYEDYEKFLADLPK